MIACSVAARNDALLRVARLPHIDALAAVAPLALSIWEGGPPAHATAVRIACVGDDLVARFTCAYDMLNVDPDWPRDRSVPGLWTRDVVELFVSDRDEGSPYRELEASPLGQWLTLAFDAPRVASAVLAPAAPHVTVRERTPAAFVVDLAAPLAQLGTRAGTVPSSLRMGVFRVTGREPDREHQTLVPVPGTTPDFHRPERWLRAEIVD